MARGARPHIYLEPLAPPAILAIYAFSTSIMLIAPWLAGLYGSPTSPAYLAPFVFTMGGLAQLSAALWAFRSRLWLTTAVAGAWATEHMAWGLVYTLIGAGLLPLPARGITALGVWYLVLGTVTAVGAVTVSRLYASLALTLSLAALGAMLAGVAELTGGLDVRRPAGWVLMACAATGWYSASAFLLQSAFGRWLLPVGLTAQTRRPPAVQPGVGEPGLKREA